MRPNPRRHSDATAPGVCEDLGSVQHNGCGIRTWVLWAPSNGHNAFAVMFQFCQRRGAALAQIPHAQHWVQVVIASGDQKQAIVWLPSLQKQ